MLLNALSALAPTPLRADEILVSAAASLTDVLKEISAAYRSKSRHTVKFNFGPSSGLARQIEEGAPVDIFFSADLPQMDTLDKNGRLEPGTRRNLLSNQLVVIVPADSRAAIAAPKDLLKAEVKRIGIADPRVVPIGVYSSKFLAAEGLWDKIKAKIVPLQDVRATLAAVASANIDAGFVYKTDAAGSTKVRIVYEIPVDEGPKIVYPIALIRESTKKAASHDFVNYLTTPVARTTFKNFGFITLD